MLKVKAGDLDRLGLLYERYKRMLFVFFFRMNHDELLSEDLVQNVFMRVIRYRHTFRGDGGPGAFRIWLFHIARNLNYEHYRKEKPEQRESLNEKHNGLSQYQDEKWHSVRDDNIRLLKMAMDRLEKGKREVLVLSKMDGFRYREIAEILDCSETAVKSKVFRALRELKKKFETIKKVYG